MKVGDQFRYTQAMADLYPDDLCGMHVGGTYTVADVHDGDPCFLDDTGNPYLLYLEQAELCTFIPSARSETSLGRAWTFARRGLRRQLTDCQLALATATRREAIKSRELVDLEAERDEWIEEAHSMARCAAELAMENTLQSIATAEHIVTPAVVEENQKILAENKRVLAQAQEMFSHNAQVHFEHMRSNSKKGPLKWLN